MWKRFGAKVRKIPSIDEPKGKYGKFWRRLVEAEGMALAVMLDDGDVERMYHALLKRAQRTGYTLHRDKQEGCLAFWLVEEGAEDGQKNQ